MIMVHLGKLLGYLLLGINAVLAALLCFSAYSPYLNPHESPVVSCVGLFFPIFLILNVAFLLFWLVAYRRYALFPLLVLLVCWSSIQTYFPMNWFQGKAPEESIKILSYNTKGFADFKPHTKETPNDILEYLQKSDADIICLQEFVWGGKLKKKDIDYALREYPYRHHHFLADGANGLGCYSRYPILSAKPVKYESASNGSITYYIKVENDTLVVINNHLESNRILPADVETYQGMVDNPNQENISTGLRKLMKKLGEANAVRSKQADVLHEMIQGLKGKKLVVCGDFNDTPISYTHRMLSEHLQDAFVESGNGVGISYNRNRMYFRIDHIFTSENISIHACEVDNSIQASDHYPVWCLVSFN
jgi:endonuclease/exonuclease/phosphatase family metal-dependent hydrolase